MYLIDGDDLYECDEADCEFEANGFWFDDEFYESCEIDLDEYDLDEDE